MPDPHPSNCIIRPMQGADALPIAAWMVEIPLWQRYGVTVSQAESMLSKGLEAGDWLFAADLSSHLLNVGFAWAIPGGAFGRGAYLRLIGVHPEWAGVGIGSGLLNAVESAASSRFRHIFLLVSDFNHEAQRFYHHHGYQQVGALNGFVLPEVIELLYWKRIPVKV